jgi:hypothetical protein
MGVLGTLVALYVLPINTPLAGRQIPPTDGAEHLGLPHLAMWFLEQGCALLPDHPQLMRAMARVFENM